MPTRKEINHIPSVDKLHIPTDSLCLQGFLIEENDEAIWLQDRGGTLQISREDIIAQEKWDCPNVRFSGEPVRVLVRDHAELLDVQTIKVNLSSEPLTLQGEVPIVKGQEELHELAVRWGRHLGIAGCEDLDSSCTAGVSFCTEIKCYGSGINRYCVPVSVPCDSRCD